MPETPGEDAAQQALGPQASAAQDTATEHCVFTLVQRALRDGSQPAGGAARDESPVAGCDGRAADALEYATHVQTLLVRISLALGTCELRDGFPGSASAHDSASEHGPSAVQAFRALLSGPRLQYAVAAHVVSQLAAADGGTLYGLTEAERLPPLFRDGAGPSKDSLAGGAKAPLGDGAASKRTAHHGIIAALQLWSWGVVQTPPVPLPPPISRAAVHAVSMRALRVALWSAAEHAAQRQRRREQVLQALVAARAREHADTATQPTGGSAGPDGGDTRTAAQPCGARAQDDTVPAGEQRLLAMARGTSLTCPLPEGACVKVAEAALRCSALSARRPPARFGHSPHAPDSRRGCGGMCPAFAAEWWGLAIGAIHMAVTHGDAGRSGDQPLPFVMFLATEIAVPPFLLPFLPALPPTNLAAALDAGYLPALERAMRVDGRRPGHKFAGLGYLIQSFTERKLVPWLLAYGEPREVAALVATGGKVLQRMADCAERLGPAGDGGAGAGREESGGDSGACDAFPLDTQDLDGLAMMDFGGLLTELAALAEPCGSAPCAPETAADPDSTAAKAAAEEAAKASTEAAAEEAGETRCAAPSVSPSSSMGAGSATTRQRQRQLLVMIAYTLLQWLPPLARLVIRSVRRGPVLAAARAMWSPLGLVLAWVAPLLHAYAEAAAQARRRGAAEATGGGGGGGGPTGGSVAATASSAAAHDTAAGLTAAAASAASANAVMWRQLLEDIDVVGLAVWGTDAMLRLEEASDVSASEKVVTDYALWALECVCVAFPERLAAALHPAAEPPPPCSQQRLCAGALQPEVVAGRRQLAEALSAVMDRRRGGAREESGSAGGGSAQGATATPASKQAAEPSWDPAALPLMEGEENGNVPAPEIGRLLATVSAAELHGLCRTCGNPACANLGGDSEAELVLRTCSGCGQVGYCGAECQRAHWREGHKAACAGRRDRPLQ